MKIRIGNMAIAVVMLFACIAFVVAGPVQAQEMAQKHSEVKGKMRIVMERYYDMIHGSKIMGEGMMRAEAMLTEGPNVLARDAKKVTAVSETERGQ
jgi:hypothetical protein